MVAAVWGIFGCPVAVRPEVNARSALRMTATSMASCVKAPATGGNRPTAATSMANPDIPIPATMLCSAMPWARLAIVNRIRDPIQPVDEDYDIGGFRRRACAPRPHCNTNICGRQSRRIVDAIADHHGRDLALLSGNCLNLVGRVTVGKNRI